MKSNNERLVADMSVKQFTSLLNEGFQRAGMDAAAILHDEMLTLRLPAGVREVSIGWSNGDESKIYPKFLHERPLVVNP